MFILKTIFLKPLKKEPNYCDCIVSLTSYGKRLNTCYLAIISMMQQTLVPKKIILYIGDESSNIKLNKKLLSLEKYGLKIVRDVKDLKGHKKYYYAMKMFPESIIITIDDDCIYPKDTIENLINIHKKYPEAVVARRVHKITIQNHNISPYSQWIMELKDSNSQPCKSLVAIGVGGVLYPPHFASADLFDIDAIKTIALNADDLWLKFYELRHGINVVWAPNNRPHPYSIPSTKKQGLYVLNVKQEGNDKVIHDIERYFDISLYSYLQ